MIKTIKEALEMAASISTEKPKESSYFPWHRWRMRMVERAMLLLAARIAARGYELFVAKEYICVNDRGWKGYIQYNQLEWTYSNCLPDGILRRNDNMVVVSSWDEVKKVIVDRAEFTRADFVKETKWMANSDSLIYINPKQCSTL